MQATIESVLEFWFGDRERPAQVVAASQASLWWGKSAAVDATIRERFGPALAAAPRGGLDAWLATVDGRLAAIIVVDQFSRNAHRDSGDAFSFDALARRWCREGIADGSDRRLRPIERLFFYLPLEHSESLDDQNQCVALLEEMAGEAEADSQETLEGFAEYARQHQRIIARFGRFPHRNNLLARQSTAAELAFLKEPGSSF